MIGQGAYRLSDSVRKKIEAEIVKYPTARAAAKSGLRYAQAEHGWVSDGVIRAVAEILGLQPIEVFEVATFYDMFYTRPVGRHQIRVCTNVSCMLRGSTQIMQQLRQELAVENGQTTEDQRFTLSEAECLGACGGAPMMMIDNDYHENLNLETLDKVLEKYE